MHTGAALRRLSPAGVVGAVLVGLSELPRLALWLRQDTAPLDALTLLATFTVETFFDLSVAAFRVTPLVLWLLIAPQRLAVTTAYRRLTLIWINAELSGLLVTMVAEWLFWNEFGGRFNFVAVDYLLYTHEMLANI